jgi:hypothetical protein
VTALRAALDKRPAPKKAQDAGLVFVTKYGECWCKDTRDNPIAKETRKLLNKLGINGRNGLGFYTLRHIFRTIADEAKDQPAVDYIMGHCDASMAGHYRERIDDSRLWAVVEHVHTWLFGDEPDGGNESNDDAPDDPPASEGDSSPDRTSPEICFCSSGSVGADEEDARPTLRLFAG